MYCHCLNKLVWVISMKSNCKIKLSFIPLSILFLFLFSCYGNDAKENTNKCLLSEATQWEKSDAYKNDSPFYCFWNKDNASVDKSCVLTLTLNNKKKYDLPYSSGEYKSIILYDYGKYEVMIKPPKQSGVITSFFLYGGVSGTPSHNEIDFEFVGERKDTVQLNYFANGVGNHEKWIDLGFDPYADFHKYAFEFGKDSVVWYIDDKKVHIIDKNNGVIPVKPLKLIFNLWCIDNNREDVKSWAGEFNYSGPIQAIFKSFVKSE